MVARYQWDVSDPRVEALERSADGVRSKIVRHPLYGSLSSAEQVRIFMETHVFAVWDFMSLLKTLQTRLTGIALPWRPVGGGLTRRLINEIVLVEESDEFETGFMSHFELYVLAMREAGANTQAIENFLTALAADGDVVRALQEAPVSASATRFVEATWDVITHGRPHELAAVFAFGREDLIPAMFEQVLDGPFGLSTFRDYLDRHVEVDQEEHTPMAARMVVELCGDDPEKWTSAGRAVSRALEARLILWDGIYAQLEPTRMSVSVIA